MVPDLHTARLVLIAVTTASLNAEKSADGSLATTLHSTIPPNWPPVDWEPHVFDLLLELHRNHPAFLDWNRYIVLPQQDGTRVLIGTVGAFWRDASPDECEVGYTILPPHEGRGLATEALGAVLDLVRQDGRIRTVIAHTFPALAASVRILEKCGFTPNGEGEERGTIRFRLAL
jgi:ribosomal-protein-alanine N-acetyltransferase